jgi:NAD(P)-dependent dehydrogenase (short-subunit alcohol dehydrogenase family)
VISSLRSRQPRKPAHVVQLFTDAMISRSNAAAKEFADAIRSLTLSDYANIQHLSLRNDGKPLGDYMCWLFSGFLSDVWFGASIANERRLLDRFDFERMVASPEQPSGTLHPSEIAATAAFLLSESASYITGSVFPVAGGLVPDPR